MHECASVFDALAAPVITTTEAGVVLSVNRRAEDLYGVSAADHVDRPLDDLFLVDGLPWSGHPGHAEQRRQGRWSGKVAHATRAGKTVWVVWSLSRVPLPGGQGNIVVALAADVTELQQSLHEATASSSGARSPPAT